ncbi:hypothetical protein BaRGS_00033988 [Batillaria attramentaria]|uniref:Bursicon n=1 Tax=Batillaria attramentaria TaxID=370345 RepID=A0ABD0JIT6_9CAEN
MITKRHRAYFGNIFRVASCGSVAVPPLSPCSCVRFLSSSVLWRENATGFEYYGKSSGLDLLVCQTALLLILSATVVSPFLYLYGGAKGKFGLDDDDIAAEAEARARSSRHASLMMVNPSPRIGVRSSLMGARDTCHVDPVRMTIRPPRSYTRWCEPVTEISFGCRGGCASYSRVDDRNATNVVRSCSCCQPTGFGFRLVSMKCEGPSGEKFVLRTTVKFARGCHCRPCYASVAIADMQTLRDLLKGTSIANIG